MSDELRATAPVVGGTPAEWTNEQIACALIVDLCRWYDAGGISHGRSLESELSEHARDLFRPHRPQGDITTWPSREKLLREAHDRIRDAALVQRPEPRHVFEPLHGNDHPHCKFCGVPQFSSEADWNNGICDKRKGARPEPREPEPLPDDMPVWKLLNEADDQSARWSAYAWQQWFVQLVAAFSAISSRLETMKADVAVRHASAPSLVCLTCGHEHYIEADEADFDSAETIPWGACKTCACKTPNYNPQLDAASARSRPQTLDYVRVLHDAKAIVNASMLYKKFIEHTPLENDVAVWMADFVFTQLDALREAQQE